jgi:hypothetical protein
MAHHVILRAPQLSAQQLPQGKQECAGMVKAREPAIADRAGLALHAPGPARRLHRRMFGKRRLVVTLKSFALVAVAALALAACNEEEAATGEDAAAEETAVECTAETAQAKMTELTTMMTELGTSDPAKLEQFSGRAAELQTQFADTAADPQAACDAIDALMAELQ